MCDISERRDVAMDGSSPRVLSDDGRARGSEGLGNYRWVESFDAVGYSTRVNWWWPGADKARETATGRTDGRLEY
jgi:hypothetical protein